MCIKLVTCQAQFLSINEDVQYFIQFNVQINNYIYIELNIWKVYQEGSYLQANIKKNLESINLRLHMNSSMFHLKEPVYMPPAVS